ncbi:MULTISPECIES: LysR substrate-binding domain-containing protein [Pseudacidovorax]|uniref:DNA-binding transcriptional LysR family regulator n=3 Tax=Pseudacidovorax intermedius TaxID=433924 RepID=A0A370F567_9BURK|nr:MULTISPECIES: LysR substrate-binding domain-containing protein [Pseudacidovorax]MBO9646397.1 LysR family transcriptional regulator [Pseudacidovorax sp.]MBP6897128.1 LysR family transcriptional regulator [Pseudacidovorax sp.]RDI18646.1 DNA-binding transcriptional LysR family regulator [Pseudacidovorax intermedius]
MTAVRIPPIQSLLAFEAVARLRSVTQAAAELSVTPSAVSHRIRQLETQLGLKLFAARGEFLPSAEGAAYLLRVREAMAALQDAPRPARAAPASTRLRVAVTPTFSRQLLLPRLALFRHAYPDIELMLQVAIPIHNVTAEEADIELRFGVGPFPDRESMHLLSDEVCPVCSPEYLGEAGPFEGDFDTEAEIGRAHLIRSPLEPWRTWFRACGIGLPEPASGNQFNDLGLVLDAAVAGFGVALMRLRLGQGWLDSGRLVRLSRRSVRSPHDYFLCWKPGTLERWECAAFVDWIRQAMRD